MHQKEAVFEASKRFKTIPLNQTFFSDTVTPIDLVEILGERVHYLLESKDDASPWSRYSFIGLNPFGYITKKNKQFCFESVQGHTLLQASNLKDSLNQTIKYLNVMPLETDIPFYGGAVGCVGYDAIADFENIELKEKPSLQLPTYYFMFCDTLIVFDHQEKNLSIIELVHFDEGDTSEIKRVKIDEAEESIIQLINEFKKAEKKQTIFQVPNSVEDKEYDHVISNYTKEKFMEDVERVKEYIRAGDIFQGVLSQRFETPISVPAMAIYRVLRVINPSPYLFYIKVEGAEIVGSSPERLVNIDHGHVEIHPIAGTRRRGKTKAEDEALAEELIHDEKEIAEHMMLVDLARNDVGRVAKYGSVQVPVLMELGRFSQVMHLVSKVTGVLDESQSPIDAFVSSFPAGTVSGAPKIRAMEIIDELEPTGRGQYAGAIGYVSYDGTIDACITIRTILIQNQRAYVQAGAGIVADSNPELEWKETRNKARALVKAIALAESYFDQKEEIHYA